MMLHSNLRRLSVERKAWKGLWHLYKMEVLLIETIQQIKRTAPQASRVTKALLHRTLNEPLTALLDDAAQQFAQAVGGEEGMEGTMAFIQKREPNWFDG
jgi:isohexenylglutaconyl-CoA hydratase